MPLPTYQELVDELKRRDPMWADGTDPLTEETLPAKIENYTDRVIAELIVERIQSLEDIKAGDIVTWGAHEVAAKVISADRELTLLHANGGVDSFRRGARPRGLIVLDPKHPLGPVHKGPITPFTRLKWFLRGLRGYQHAYSARRSAGS